MSFELLTDYANIDLKAVSKLPCLKGSARRVHVLNNDVVIKIAMNEKGLAQNEAESMLSGEHVLLNEVLFTSWNYKYIIARRAEKVKHIGTIRRLLNVGVKGFHDLLNELEQTLDILDGDTDRPSAWGIVNGSPVLIDYGFTTPVRDIYWGRR